MKRIDTHSHPKISKHFEFSPAAVDKMLRQARRVHLDALALTEHCHATRYWDVHEHLERTLPCEHGLFRAPGMALVPGAQARALGLPIVAGSDAHHWLQVGVRHTLLHTDELTLHAIAKTIKEGLTGLAGASYTPLHVKAAKS